MSASPHFETQAIHAGHWTDPSRAVMPPLVLSTTFERGDDGLGFPGGFVYGRYGNPNRQALETKLTALEGGYETVTFASGLAAAQALIHTLGAGSHLILPDDVYFGVRSIAENLYPQWQLRVSRVDLANLDALRAAITPQTRLIWTETPSNPRLKLTDLAAVAELARAHRILTVCDNTWAPLLQRPLALGIDIVLHSTTKYLGGHSDLLGGSLSFAQPGPGLEQVRLIQKTGGAVPSPFDCWLLARSLATLPLRMRAHAANAQQLAEFLQSQPGIEQVLYPGLPTDPYHAVAQKQMQGGFGGMLSIMVKGGQAEALKLAQGLQLFKHATSLGGVESLIEHRQSIEGATSVAPANLLRVSVGLEHIDDLKQDFAQALA
ncbi:MAG: PLP-dependent aspartate aminotransferase family protein [Bernardetiaceae bacterium]|jgi:cystathionine gamma-synthase|nr:PLP-dependent aspartate aminotransferase family protein [Bernardetiaceae bacterium]